MRIGIFAPDLQFVIKDGNRGVAQDSVGGAYDEHARAVANSTQNPRKSRAFSQGGAPARCTDSDLQSVIDAWPDLPDEARAAIMGVLDEYSE